MPAPGMSEVGSVPVPDPTLLTTQQLLGAIANLKELFSTRLDAMDKAIVLFNENITRVPTDTDKQISRLRELIESKLEASERAIQLLSEQASQSRERIDEKIVALCDLHEEKFASIQVQFKERDVRTEQSSKDSKVAVDAALQAAKEAVGEQNKSSALAIAKSEASTMKQIDQIGQMITTTNKATDDKFSDLKDRMTRLEGLGTAAAPQIIELVTEVKSLRDSRSVQTGFDAGKATLIGGVGLLGGGGVVALLMNLMKH